MLAAPVRNVYSWIKLTIDSFDSNSKNRIEEFVDAKQFENPPPPPPKV